MFFFNSTGDMGRPPPYPGPQEYSYVREMEELNVIFVYDEKRKEKNNNWGRVRATKGTQREISNI